MYVFYVGYERMIGKVASPDCQSKFQIQRSSLIVTEQMFKICFPNMSLFPPQQTHSDYTSTWWLILGEKKSTWLFSSSKQSN